MPRFPAGKTLPDVLWWMWPVPVVTLAALYAWMSVTIGDINDLYWHVRLGEDIWAHHRLGGDPAWIYGPVGNPDQVTTQSVSEVLMYGLFSVGGWQIFQALRLVAMIAFALLTWWAASVVVPRGRWAGWIPTAVVTSASLVSIPMFMSERPQTVSMVLLVPLSVILYRALLTGRWPNAVAMFAFVAVWGWFHGLALLVPLLLVGVWGLRLLIGAALKSEYPDLGQARWWRRPMVVVLAATAGTIANPIGLDILVTAGNIREVSTTFISEWLPPTLMGDVVIALLWLVVLWAVGAVAWAYRGLPIRVLALEGAWVGALFLLAAQANRTAFVAGVLILPVAARRFMGAWPFAGAPTPGISLLPRWGKTALAAVGVLTVLAVSVPAIYQGNGLPAKSPLRIYAGLAEQDRPKFVVTEWNIAGPLQMHSGPGTVTNIDGRGDRYGVDVIEDYFAMMEGRDDGMLMWRTLESRTTDVVVNVDKSGLYTLLRESGDWRIVCRDGAYAWLTRVDTSGSCPWSVPASGLPVTGLGG